MLLGKKLSRAFFCNKAGISQRGIATRAFSLIEIVIVIIIIGTLTGIIGFGVNKLRESSRVTKLQNDVRRLNQAIDIVADRVGVAEFHKIATNQPNKVLDILKSAISEENRHMFVGLTDAMVNKNLNAAQGANGKKAARWASDEGKFIMVRKGAATDILRFNLNGSPPSGNARFVEANNSGFHYSPSKSKSWVEGGFGGVANDDKTNNKQKLAAVKDDVSLDFGTASANKSALKAPQVSFANPIGGQPPSNYPSENSGQISRDYSILDYPQEITITNPNGTGKLEYSLDGENWQTYGDDFKEVKFRPLNFSLRVKSETNEEDSSPVTAVSLTPKKITLEKLELSFADPNRDYFNDAWDDTVTINVQDPNDSNLSQFYFKMFRTNNLTERRFDENYLNIQRQHANNGADVIAWIRPRTEYKEFFTRTNESYLIVRVRLPPPSVIDNDCKLYREAVDTNLPNNPITMQRAEEIMGTDMFNFLSPYSGQYLNNFNFVLGNFKNADGTWTRRKKTQLVNTYNRYVVDNKLPWKATRCVRVVNNKDVSDDDGSTVNVTNNVIEVKDKSGLPVPFKVAPTTLLGDHYYYCGKAYRNLPGDFQEINTGTYRFTGGYGVVVCYETSGGTGIDSKNVKIDSYSAPEPDYEHRFIRSHKAGIGNPNFGQFDVAKTLIIADVSSSMFYDPDLSPHNKRLRALYQMIYDQMVNRKLKQDESVQVGLLVMHDRGQNQVVLDAKNYNNPRQILGALDSFKGGAIRKALYANDSLLTSTFADGNATTATRYDEAFDTALAHIKENPKLYQNIIFVSDGAPIDKTDSLYNSDPQAFREKHLNTVSEIKNLGVIVNTMSFGIRTDEEAKEILKKTAEAGGGKYENKTF